MTKKRISPPLLIVIIFLITIMSGSVLLMLPFSHHGKLSITDAVFTETSAVCVTGLIVKDTGRDFTLWGQLILLISIQLGGLGIMTISTFFYHLIKKDISLSNQQVIRELVAKNDFFDIANLVIKIVTYTFIIETIGALLFAIKFIPLYGWGHGTYYSIFHSVSSFCNAGFSTFSTSLSHFYNSPLVLLTSAFLLIFGGLGFLVLYELLELNIFKKNIKVKIKKLSVQAKIMVSATLFLLVIGAILFYFFEMKNTLKGYSLGNKVLVSFYQSATPRTAGFNVVDMGHVKPVTLLLNDILMFIGAGPGSTAGGIKITTIILLIMVLFSFIREKDKVVMYKKTIPPIIVFRAVSIFLFAIFWVIIAYFILLGTNFHVPISQNQDVSQRLLFELISAFGTVGLSTGITPYLNMIGKLLIIVTMFVGRLGPTLIALTIRKDMFYSQISYPEERIMVG